MRNFIFGVGVGLTVGYIFHKNIDRTIREAVEKANQKLDEQPTTTEETSA